MMFVAMEGTVKFNQESNFLKVVDELYQQKHINDEGLFIDKQGVPISPDEFPNVDTEMLCISVPYFLYQDLSPKSLFGEGGKGVIIAASNDGCFNGWLFSDGDEHNYDLYQWASENFHVRKPEGDDAELNEWQHEVIAMFMDDV